MSCGAGSCGSGGCGFKASSTGGGGAAAPDGQHPSGGEGGCANGECGASTWDGRYRDVVGLQIGFHAKTWYFDSTGLELVPGDFCVTEGDSGEEFARVVQAAGPSRKFAAAKNMKRVLRPASPEDQGTHERMLALRMEVLEYCRGRVAALGLDMKLSDAEPSFDGRRLLVTYTSDERVDFRELVRDLSQQFRKRIELRQVGARDEAKMIGGYGICGRPLCCSTFLGDFPPISIKMAKRQGIGMNPSKISGLCGRLMCCLRFEDYDDPKHPVPRPPHSSSSDPAPATAL